MGFFLGVGGVFFFYCLKFMFERKPFLGTKKKEKLKK